jgi:hypothetical protein
VLSKLQKEKKEILKRMDLLSKDKEDRDAIHSDASPSFLKTRESDIEIDQLKEVNLIIRPLEYRRIEIREK